MMNKRYKCYHSNFKSNQIYLTPNIFWRNDSKSDSIKVIGTMNTFGHKEDIKTDGRVYKTIDEIEKICKQKSENNTKCFMGYQNSWLNLGLFDLEKLDLSKYIIFINEDSIPEFFPEHKEEKKKRIMLNEYHENRTYHKRR